MGGPLILTLKLDEAAQSFYEELRQRYFPPARNVIPAHLTLFHQLPDQERTYAVLDEAAQGTAPMELRFPRLRSLGRGVAAFFEGGELLGLHRELSAAFQDDLTAQDRQRFQPHIVIQNKVDGAAAKRTLAELQGAKLLEGRGMGLTVWRYLGGPWEFAEEFLFERDREGAEWTFPL